MQAAMLKHAQMSTPEAVNERRLQLAFRMGLYQSIKSSIASYSQSAVACEYRHQATECSKLFGEQGCAVWPRRSNAWGAPP